jgi:hypothetical protein
MEDIHEISERNRTAARLYEQYAREFAHLKKNRAVEWLELRKEAKSIKETDMLWDASSNGQRYNELKALMEGLSKVMSAEKAHLRVLDQFGN